MESKILATMLAMHCRELEQLLSDVLVEESPFEVSKSDLQRFDLAGMAVTATASVKIAARLRRILFLLEISTVAEARKLSLADEMTSTSSWKELKEVLILTNSWKVRELSFIGILDGVHQGINIRSP